MTAIRQITLADVAAFHGVLDVVAREKRWLALTEAPPMEGVEAFVRSNVERGNPQLVVEAGGSIVGWCDVVPGGRATLAHVGTLGMGLLPAWRGRGVGERLIREAIAASRAFGIVRLQLTVFTRNTSAQALYRKVGFLEEGRRRAAVRIDGELLDDIMMAMILD